MELPPPYNAPPSVQARLRILDWITDHGDTAPLRIVALGPLFEAQERDEARATAGHLAALETENLIHLHKTIGFGGWSCDVLAARLDYTEQVRERRDNRRRRRQAARDAFLHWLYDCTLNGETSPLIDAFSPSPYGSYYGLTYTAQEVEAASDWLNAEGYLAGSSFPGIGVARAVITTKGERAVESERSVNADTQPPYSVTTVNVTGSGNNVAANSSNVTQTTTVTMTNENSRQLLGLAESLAQLTNAGLLGLDEEQTREAALVVESLRETAQQDAAPGGDVRTLLDKAKAVALSGTGTAIGQTVVAAVEQVIQALGLG